MPYAVTEKEKIAKGHREISGSELDAPPEKRLKYVVLDRYLVDNIDNKLEDYITDKQVRFDLRFNMDKYLGYILDPMWTELSGLPPILFSENDTRDWFRSVLGNPSTCLLNAVEKLTRQDEDQNALVKPEKQTYHLVSASPKDHKVVPDLMLVEKDIAKLKNEELKYNIYDQKVRCIIELKTENSYEEDTFEELFDSIKDKYAIPFVWPTKSDKSKKRNAARMILQVRFV